MNPRNERQRLIAGWIDRTNALVCAAPFSARERALRVLEEAIELAQSADISKDEVSVLAQRVYRRPVGTYFEELGQLGICLLAAGEATHNWVDELEANVLLTIMSHTPDYYIQRMRQKVKDMPTLYTSKEVCAAEDNIDIREYKP